MKTRKVLENSISAKYIIVQLVRWFLGGAQCCLQLTNLCVILTVRFGATYIKISALVNFWW